MTSETRGESLRRLVDRLRAETGASRTTVRGPAGGDPVALHDGEMIGTISVHQQDVTRHWTEADIAALKRAQDDVAVPAGPGPSPGCSVVY